MELPSPIAFEQPQNTIKTQKEEIIKMEKMNEKATDDKKKLMVGEHEASDNENDIGYVERILGTNLNVMERYINMSINAIFHDHFMRYRERAILSTSSRYSPSMSNLLFISLKNSFDMFSEKCPLSDMDELILYALSRITECYKWYLDVDGESNALRFAIHLIDTIRENIKYLNVLAMTDDKLVNGKKSFGNMCFKVKAERLVSRCRLIVPDWDQYPLFMYQVTSERDPNWSVIRLYNATMIVLDAIRTIVPSKDEFYMIHSVCLELIHHCYLEIQILRYSMNWISCLFSDVDVEMLNTFTAPEWKEDAVLGLDISEDAMRRVFCSASMIAQKIVHSGVSDNTTSVPSTVPECKGNNV